MITRTDQLTDQLELISALNESERLIRQLLRSNPHYVLNNTLNERADAISRRAAGVIRGIDEIYLRTGK